MGSKRPRIMVTEAEYEAIICMWAEWDAAHDMDEGEEGAVYRRNTARLERFTERWVREAGR